MVSHQQRLWPGTIEGTIAGDIDFITEDIPSIASIAEEIASMTSPTLPIPPPPPAGGLGIDRV